MNSTEYSYILNHPAAIREKQARELERLLLEFPYFQSARALRLKGLHNQDSYQYNQALKVAAAYTTDRSVLFDFITSGQFTGLQQAFYEEKEARIKEIVVRESEIIAFAAPPEMEKPQPKANTLEQSILTSIKEATPQPVTEAEPVPTAAPTLEEKLEIGKPLEFSKEETHSFQEWLQLANFRPIERENQAAETLAPDPEKQKKLDLIDKFIESNPKIPPVKDSPLTAAIPRNTEDTSYLMTETLAKVYLEQKKYQKAIQAYEILILKYPEKSSLFADRISDIKILQQNNH